LSAILALLLVVVDSAVARLAVGLISGIALILALALRLSGAVCGDVIYTTVSIAVDRLEAGGLDVTRSVVIAVNSLRAGRLSMSDLAVLLVSLELILLRVSLSDVSGFLAQTA
jgi:hypothetical protein